MKMFFYCFSLTVISLSLNFGISKDNPMELSFQDELNTPTQCSNNENYINESLHDNNYNNSAKREKLLQNKGIENVADIECNVREEYIEGGGYTSKDGGRQIHYQCSKEQEDDLKMIDEYFGF